MKFFSLSFFLILIMRLAPTPTPTRHACLARLVPATTRIVGHVRQRAASLVTAATADAKAGGTTTTNASAVLSKLAQTAAAASAAAEVVVIGDGGKLSAGLALGLLRAGLRVTLGEEKN